MPMHICTTVSRRSLLAGGAATALIGTASNFVVVTPARAQTTLTPDAALQQMMEGNRRFAAGQPRSLNDDLAMLRQKTEEKQEPFAAVLACADSRVPVELVF